MLSPDDVKKLAELSLIDVPEEELSRLAGEVDAILGYVGELSKLASEELHAEVPPLHNVFRDDENPRSGGEYTEALLSAAPGRSGQYLRVKRVL